MTIEAFLIQTLQQALSSIPELIVVITLIGSQLKTVKETTNMFPEIATKTKNEVVSVKKELTESFEKTTQEVKEIVSEAVHDIAKEVNEELSGMKDALVGYKEELLATKSQTNLLVKENKLFMDIITILLSGDPEKIRNGISQTILNQLNMTKEELENLPNDLVTNLPLLKDALKEILVVAGSQAIDVLLKEIGYEQRTNS